MNKSIYYLVNWGSDKQRAWSGTNWGLYQALKKRMDVYDIDTTIGMTLNRILYKLHLKSRDMDMANIKKGANKAKAVIAKNGMKDAVFQFSEMLPNSFGMPTYIYFDLSVDRVAYMREHDPEDFKVSNFQMYDRLTIVNRGGAE